MAVKEILKIPNKILNLKASEAEFNDGLKSLVSDLIDTLEVQQNPKGAGLAAPQIGISKRVFVVKKFSPDPVDLEKELETTFILINPELVTNSEATSVYWEGCLSIPDTYGEVERFKRVRVKFYDLKGEEIIMKAEGFFARVIQHEIDHLNGILFTSKVVGRTYTEKELDEMEKSKQETLKDEAHREY